MSHVQNHPSRRSWGRVGQRQFKTKLVERPPSRCKIKIRQSLRVVLQSGPSAPERKISRNSKLSTPRRSFDTSQNTDSNWMSKTCCHKELRMAPYLHRSQPSPRRGTGVRDRAHGIESQRLVRRFK